jgi:hypothetical protein
MHMALLCQRGMSERNPIIEQPVGACAPPVVIKDRLVLKVV